MKENKRSKFNEFFSRDVKEFNGIILSLVSVIFLVVCGVISYQVNSSHTYDKG